MASLKFTEVSKFLYAHFHDETSRCQADIASNELQTCDFINPKNLKIHIFSLKQNQ